MKINPRQQTGVAQALSSTFMTNGTLTLLSRPLPRGAQPRASKFESPQAFDNSFVGSSSIGLCGSL